MTRGIIWYAKIIYQNFYVKCQRWLVRGFGQSVGEPFYLTPSLSALRAPATFPNRFNLRSSQQIYHHRNGPVTKTPKPLTAAPLGFLYLYPPIILSPKRHDVLHTLLPPTTSILDPNPQFRPCALYSLHVMEGPFRRHRFPLAHCCRSFRKYGASVSEGGSTILMEQGNEHTDWGGGCIQC